MHETVAPGAPLLLQSEAETGTPVLAETTTWAGADIADYAFFAPSTAWAKDELIRISGETDAPDACCGGGVVSLGFRTAEERLQTWTQFISPNNGISHATTSIEELGSAFECSQPVDAFFGTTGNFGFQVERFAMSGESPTWLSISCKRPACSVEGASWTRNPSRIISPTVMRGFRLLYGSWNTS